MKKIRASAIVLSIFLHLLLLLIFGLFRNIPSDTVLPKGESKMTDLVFELVETPSADEQTAPEDTDFISDKDMLAQDLAQNELPASDKPYQPESAEIFNLLSPLQSEEDLNKEILDESAQIFSELQNNRKSFWETFEAQKQLNDLQQQKPEYENLLSQVKNHGGMSLNTYQWDFAPYLLEMKRKVQSHNNPPFAFTHLGAISGDILLRFKVLQDGSVQDLEILNSTAHYSLETTSTRAITFSAPFKPLPSNFPKEYLEITALFSYIIRK
jgi:hypothetical protein